MNTLLTGNPRVLSGMRPTGAMHLGHLHGALKNWVELQHEYECFFFVADWHALTTNYDDPSGIAASAHEMVIDWLASGVDPRAATLFIQSRVPEHAELHLLLSMMTPLGWLERVPTYKDQKQQLKDRDLDMYGFLGYPVLQSADILIYRAGQVPVGEDQVAHVEMTREIARRFNHIYGKEADFVEKAEAAIKSLGQTAGQYRELRRRYQERGDDQALLDAQELLKTEQNLTQGDRERLAGYLEGNVRTILVEPQALLTKTAKMPGLDGRKMSKSYGNSIALREDPKAIEQKMRTMPTDPARVRRTDPGNQEKCPVWDFHKVYSDEETRDWVWQGCTTAGIGCIDCKKSVISKIQQELEPIRERAREYETHPDLVRDIMNEGNARASAAAQDTMNDVRQVMGLAYK
ncbi:MAG TPA: tryptophan--tRNA ligase [Gammaproteobacteria bacterium]|nr:tryptophan--tRNA ligase [Gammaproteobacteria bacterium]